MQEIEKYRLLECIELFGFVSVSQAQNIQYLYKYRPYRPEYRPNYRQSIVLTESVLYSGRYSVGSLVD